jgi:DNA-binding MarR family transcriptional regulator
VGKGSVESDYLAAAELRIQLLSFQRRTEEITGRHRITPERYLLLLLVHAATLTETRSTVTSLCGPLQMTQSAVSRLVAGAVRAGLVDREFDSRDRRRSYLGLTREGEARLDQVFHELGPERAKLAETLAGV